MGKSDNNLWNKFSSITRFTLKCSFILFDVLCIMFLLIFNKLRQNLLEIHLFNTSAIYFVVYGSFFTVVWLRAREKNG
jgi:hypothetical protein